MPAKSKQQQKFMGLVRAVQKGEVPKSYYEIPIGKSNILKKGKDITLISNSYTITECLRAYEILKKNFISVEIIDLQSLRPLDCKTIIKSWYRSK